MCCQKEQHVECRLLIAFRNEYRTRYKKSDDDAENGVMEWLHQVAILEDILLRALGVTPNILRGK